MAGHKGKMPNDSKGYGAGNRSMGSNKGASTGLKKQSSARKDVMAQPTNKNPFPDGLA